MSTAEGTTNTVRALERGLDVIAFFTHRERPATIADVASGTGLDRAVARRILATLEKRSYVALVHGGYVLQPSVLELGYAYLSSDPLPLIADARLRPLSQQLEESCSLGVLRNGRVIYLATAQYKRVAGPPLTVGTMSVPATTSVGRFLLAHLPDQPMGVVLDTLELPRFTPSTITDKAHLVAELARVRQQGWCLIDQEMELGLLALSVGVRDSTGQVIAAINATTHTSRSDSEQLLAQALPALRVTADEIERDLQHARAR